MCQPFFAPARSAGAFCFLGGVKKTRMKCGDPHGRIGASQNPQNNTKGADGCGVTTKELQNFSTIRERLTWLLTEPREFLPEGQDNGMAIALALLELAKGGNLNAIREVIAMVGEDSGSTKEVVIVDDVQT